MAEAAAAPLAKPRPLSPLDQFFLSCLWLGYNAQWGALLFLVLPAQVQLLVGPEQKERTFGFLLMVGAAVSLIVTPVAGALSDRCGHSLGRRRPYLIAGVVLNVVFLLFMSRFGRGSSLALFGLCYLGVQFGCNWWGGPYAGLIPDIVPREQVGGASGWQALMTALGTITGVVAGSALRSRTGFVPVYAFIAVVLVIALLLTVWGVRERPLPTPPPALDFPKFFRSFLPDSREHWNFQWVLVTRALINMGVYSVSPFFLYFLKDVIGVGSPAHGGNTVQVFFLTLHPDNPASVATTALMAIILGMGVPTGLLAGYYSDRQGRKPWVYLAGGIMSGACCIYVAVTCIPHPSLQLTFLVASLYGVGNGAYQAVDWALALDVLPSGEAAAKDMGVWHVAMVLPQVFAPALAGILVGGLKHHSLTLAYTVLFAMSALWFTLGTALVRQIRGVR